MVGYSLFPTDATSCDKTICTLNDARIQALNQNGDLERQSRMYEQMKEILEGITRGWAEDDPGKYGIALKIPF